MKAFILDRYEKKGALRFGDTPEPQLWDGDVLVEIHAAGLNQLDPKIRDGEFKVILPYRLPLMATGAILTTRLLYAMKRDGLVKGIVTLCIGGGQGVALALEAL